jgi:arylsulfatase
LGCPADQRPELTARQGYERAVVEWKPSPASLVGQAEPASGELLLFPDEAKHTLHLWRGWARLVEFRNETTPFIWSDGDSSSIRFFLNKTQDLSLGLTVTPVSLLGTRVQTIDVLANGTLIGRLKAAAGESSNHTVTVPADALVTGFNEVVLSYGSVMRPMDTDPASSDARQLAVSVDRIALSIATVDPSQTTMKLGEQSVDGLLQRRSGSFSYLLSVPSDAQMHTTIHLSSSSEPPLDPVTVEVSAYDDNGVQMLWSSTLAEVASPKAVTLDLSRYAGRAIKLQLSADGLLGGDSILWGDLRVAGTSLIRSKGSQPSAPTLNLVVIILDALSRSRVGIYGYSSETTPEIDALAGESLVFSNAHSNAPYTLSSTASLLTSLEPVDHRVLTGNEYLGDSFLTLAEVLKEQGHYQTATFTSNAFASPEFGLGQGFDTFEKLYEDSVRPTVTVPEQFRVAVTKWLDARAEADLSVQPFFLYLHMLQPHEPLDVAPPEFYEAGENTLLGPTLSDYAQARDLPSPEELERHIRLYEGSLRFADHGVRQILELLRTRGLLESSIIVVASDHGEALGESGLIGHNTSVDEAMTAIPLLIRFPQEQQTYGQTERIASSIDVAPTALHALGLRSPAEFHGHDLLAPETETSREGRLVYSRAVGNTQTAETGIWYNEFKLTFKARENPARILTTDWKSKKDRSAEFPVTAMFLENERLAYRNREAEEVAGELQTNQISAETKESLRALGYIVD